MVSEAFESKYTFSARSRSSSQQTCKTIGTIHGIAFVMIALILIENWLLTLQLKMLLSPLQMPPTLLSLHQHLVFLEFLSSVIKFDSIFILFFALLLPIERKEFLCEIEQAEKCHSIQQKKNIRLEVRRKTKFNTKIEPFEIKCTNVRMKYNIPTLQRRRAYNFANENSLFPYFVRLVRFRFVHSLILFVGIGHYDTIAIPFLWSLFARLPANAKYTLIYHRHSVIAFGSMTEISRRFKLRHRLMPVLLESIPSTLPPQQQLTICHHQRIHHHRYRIHSRVAFQRRKSGDEK